MKDHLTLTRETMETKGNPSTINEMMNTGDSMAFESNKHAHTEIVESSDMNYSEGGPKQSEESK